MAGTLYEGFFVQGDVAGGGTTTHTTVRPLELYDAEVYATATAGGGTIKVTTAGGDFTNTMACATDTNIARATLLTFANKLAGTGTTISFVGASGASGTATVYCIVTGSGIALP